MKILKYLVATIVVLMVVFLTIGFLIPSVDYGHKITVNKPIEEAWAVAQDESKYDQWLEGFQSIVLVEGKKGTVGSRYKVVVNPGDGQPDFLMTETVVSIEKFDHVSLSFDSEMMDFEQTISYSSEDGTTTIVTDSKVMGKGLTMRSMFALMEMLGGAFKKQEVKNIEALKMVIKENTTDYYPIQNEDELVLEE